jgi:hypothetical protein
VLGRIAFPGCPDENFERLLLCAALSLPLEAAWAQVHSELAIQPNGDNERAEISQWIGLVKVTIDYPNPDAVVPLVRIRGGGYERS